MAEKKDTMAEKKDAYSNSKSNSKSNSNSNSKKEGEKSPEKPVAAESLFEEEFKKLWDDWPKEGRFKKKICHDKFKALIKKGKLNLFKKVTLGYSEFLRDQEVKKNFKQRVMHLSTWLNNWEEERDQYENFEYKPPL